MHMDATRTERITVNLTLELIQRLDRFAEQHRWTRSTAAAILIEQGVAEDAAPRCS
jgi:metal-responsive CopG/Arc/MetJ family transcriptional regulator